LLTLESNIQLIQGQFFQEYVEEIVLGGLDGPSVPLKIYSSIDLSLPGERVRACEVLEDLISALDKKWRDVCYTKWSSGEGV
jgi:hypothetical protein